MTIRNLEYLFEPGTVAVIGATESESSIAGIVTRNLIERFRGPVSLVNPTRKTVYGRPCHARIEDLESPPDLALITSPADTVVDAMTSLGQLGARSAVIISDPKRGTQPAVDVRRRIFQIAEKYYIRVAGPNCLGLSAPPIGLHASMSRFEARPGTIAFVGQSATAAGPLVDWANLHGLGFSHVISLGDMIDVDYADVLFYLAANRRCRAIVLYAERLPFARRFLSAARHAARVKPVIIMKAGAQSGDYLPESAVIDPFLPSRDAVYDGAFRRAGMLRVRTLEELFDTVEAFSARLPADMQPGHGDRLAILANGESIGTMAVDSLIERGCQLADLAPETIDRLSAVMPPSRPRTNPVDILPDASGERYAGALNALMDDPNTDAVLVMAGPTGVASGEDTAKAVAATVEKARQMPGKRRPWVLTSWPGGEEAAAARRVFAAAHIPTFETPSAAVAVFSVLLNHHDVSIGLRETPASIPAAFAVDPASAHHIIADARRSGHQRLDPTDTQAVLSAYGLAQSDEYMEADPIRWRIRTAIDPEFGPILSLGLCGPEGDLMSQPVVGLPPLNQTLAQDVIFSHALGPRLFRQSGRQGHRDALGLALTQVSQMLVDLADIIRMDLDGIAVSAQGITWSKARIDIAKAPVTGATARDRLAIRPYPKEMEKRVTSRAGLDLTLRPIRPEDEPALADMFAQLSADDIRRRFFRPIRLMDHEFMGALTQVDYDWHMAFVLTGPGLPGAAEIHGVVRLVRDPRGESAEYAVVIRSDKQGHGLGRMLMDRIIAYAREVGFTSIYGHVLAENEGMLALNRKLGFSVKREPDEPGVMRVELIL